MTRWKTYCSATALLLVVGFTTAAQATVTLVRGGGDDPQLTGNVTLNLGETSASGPLLGNVEDRVTGATIATDAIAFTSSSDVLIALSSGAANIGSTTGDIEQLTAMAVSPFLGFEAFQLRLQGAAGTEVRFEVTDQEGPPPAFIFDDITLTGIAGQDRFTFTTDALQFITSFSFFSSSGVIATVDQVRIGSLVVPGPIAGAGLPALLALGGFAWIRRRRSA